MCSGYYSYRGGYDEFPGRERFNGDIIHPQHYQKISTIQANVWSSSVRERPHPRSAIAGDSAHVTMLQRLYLDGRTTRR